MSLGGDILVWLRGQTIPGIANAGQIDYAPTSRKGYPDALSVGLISPPPVESYEYFGGYFEHSTRIQVAGKREADVTAAQPVVRSLEGMSGELAFTAPMGYPAKTNIVHVRLEDVTTVQDEDEGLVTHEYNFAILTN